jgi:hypothetical protein
VVDARDAPAERAAPDDRTGVTAFDTSVVVGDTLAFVGVAGVLIVAGGLVAAINSAAPFDHGSWLAAYLVLVGGLAQLVLGAGCLALPAPVCATGLRRAQLALWNVGIAIVAVGVFIDVPAVVVAGSVVVVGALAAFAYGAGPTRPQAAGRVTLYRLVVIVLAISVVIGSFLAGAAPGT